MKTKNLISIRATSAILAMTVVLSAGSAMAALTAPQINGAPATTGPTIVDLKTPPTITVTSSVYDQVWVKFFTSNGATWRLPMTNGGAQYAIVMPVMPAGTISYRIEAGPVFDAYSDTNAVEFLPTSGTYTYVNSETLTIQRQPNLAAWRPIVGTGPALYTGSPDAYWRGVKLTMNNVDNTVNLAGIKPATAGPPADPSVRTVSSLTVGTIWFKARFAGEGAGTLIVEKSTSSGHTSAHTLVETIAVPYSSTWVQYRIDINSDSPAWYRIRHASGFETEDIVIKDIVISAPAADVVLFKDEVDYSPGYPSRDDPVTFKVSVTNVIAGAPAANISPKLVWRLNEGAWTQTPMPLLSGNRYEVTLPKMNPGKFEYYYRADFTGYAYTGELYPVLKNPSVENESAFAIWLDASKKIAETKGPAYYPDFENSHLYNLGLEPPQALKGGSTAPEPFSYLSFNIRRFRSMHDALTLALVPTDGTNLNVEPSYTMEQVGDYTWQSVLHITNAIDIGASVLGTYRYTNNAAAFEQSTVEWLEDNQDVGARNPPMSGNAVDTSGTDPIQIQMNYNGFIMFRFCTTNGYYEVRRAAWQDFNTWQANNTEFSRSFGLFQTVTYESDLVGKSPTVMSSALIPSFEVGTTVSPSILNATYFNGLRVDKAWLIEERTNKVIGANSYKNRAIKVAASPTSYGIGSIQTTSASATPGRDTLRMRIRASMDDEHAAVYRYGALFQNYKVTAKAKTLSMSDGTNASVSVYGYYLDKNNYIEARLTQERSTINYLSLKLLQAKNGVVSTLQSVNYTSGYPTLMSATEWFLTLTVTTVPLSDVSGTATFQLGTSASPSVATCTSGFNVDYPNAYIGGTIAVNSRDAQTQIKVSMTTDGGASPAEFSAVETSSQSAWNMGGLMDVSGAPRWTLATGPTMLTREIPVVKYRVSVFRDGLATNNVIAPVPSSDSDWDTEWDLNGNGDEEKSVNTFVYQEVSIPMHLWDNVFIQVAPTGSDGFLVVDDLDVKAWRGLTLYDPTLSPNDPDEELVWKATYAVVTDYDRGNLGYELARSRADPEEVQMIVSPLLLDGIGDILFNYSVTNGTVSFSVESLRQNGSVHELLYTNTVTATPGTNTILKAYVAALTNITGRLRIRINNDESSSDGILFVDNLKATNYPDVGDTSWEAYNALISTFDFNTSVKFDGAANIDFRSAALNNSYTADTPLGVAYDEHKPYLQSPKIETGIGEVSFWYRAYPDPLTGNPGNLYLKAAKYVGTPDEEWITLGKDDLNADSPLYAQQVESLDGLTNITSSAWAYFSVEFFKADYKIFRIYSDITLNDRVMLDNILVTEPVRTSIEIASVELIPAVPLYTDKVGIRVNLTNPRMNPTVTKVSLLYMTGTSVWGRANWTSTNEVSLVQDPVDKYLFTVTNAIPKKPIDTIVQYAVRVDYTGTFASPVFYDEEFVNPSWYEPIDLNEQFAPASRTPYYYVFSVGTNCVFINEFLPFGSGFFTGYVGLSEQYVELIGIENGNIENWRLETIRPAASQQKDVAIWTNVLMSAIDSKTQFTTRFVSGSSEPTDKGWGFYTLACAGVSVTNSHFNANNPIIVDQELYPASLYTPGYTAPVNENNIIGLAEPGALSLKRSMGAYVQRIAWGAPSSIQALLDRGYEQLPVRGASSTLYRKVYTWAGDGNPEGESLAWGVQLPALYSPGYYNTSQAELIWTLDPAPEEEPDVDPPAITVSVKSIQLALTQATIQFAVSSTNSFALTPESGFAWTIETSEDVSFTTPLSYPISGVITAPDTGAESLYSVDVDLDEPVLPTLFYRVKATHP